MIYQFDEEWNGRVVTELVDPRATKDLYKGTVLDLGDLATSDIDICPIKGLHFPASDIPAQARALYRINKVRLLYDRDQTTARFVCKTKEDLTNPVDLTHCEYLSSSLSLNNFADTSNSIVNTPKHF
jgi:light-regulated signal transduction histidine kinase (bacteriophytochrome)